MTATAPTVHRGSADYELMALLAVWVGTVCAFATVYVLFHDHPFAPVIDPLAALTALAILFYYSLWRRERSAPFFTLGGFGAAMAYVYAAYPLVVYLGNHGIYTIHNDDRLYAWQPRAEELGELAWWYVAYFAAFTIAYFPVSGGAHRLQLDKGSAPRGIVKLIIALFIGTQCVIVATRYGFDMNPTSYLDSYRVIQQLPTFVRQIFSITSMAQPTLAILLLCVLFIDYRRNRFWIAAMLLTIIVNSVTQMGARGVMFAMIIVTLTLYHNVVRRIPMLLAVAGGVFLLLASTILGIMRMGHEVDRGSGFGVSEFEVIFGNAYELKFFQRADGALLSNPPAYFADFAAMVPQQITPFQKTTKADWFIQTYHPIVAAFGGGFAFGVLSEAITGFGWPEIVVRGALIGLIFGLFHRALMRKPVSIWRLAFYLWLTIWTYQVMRNTTFCLLAWAEYHFLLPVIAVRGIYYVLSSSKRRLRASFAPLRPSTSA